MAGRRRRKHDRIVLPSLPSSIIQHILDFVPLRCPECKSIVEVPDYVTRRLQLHCHCNSDQCTQTCLYYRPSQRFLTTNFYKHANSWYDWCNA